MSQALKSNNKIMNVVEKFELIVKEFPELSAIVYKNKHISYKSLNEKSNQISEYLKCQGVKPDDFVAILLEPGIDFMVCMLAIIKTGGIYLPLDILTPKKRLNEILVDANPKFIIANDKFGALISDLNKIRNIKDIKSECQAFSTKNPVVKISPAAPIYMMYTSGSTRKPKGVIISHQAVVNLCHTDNFAKITHKETVSQFSNLAFDGATFEIWTALLNGATLSIIPSIIRGNRNKLQAHLKNNPLDCLFLPTGFFHQLVKSFPEIFDNVKKIMFGGEQVNYLLLKNFLEYRKTEQKPITVINAYGPTEATTCTCRQVMTEQDSLSDEELMSVGIPLQNVKTYLLDDNLQPAIEGELCISGINLAVGYHNSEELNQEKFISNPFSTDPLYQQLYKTGDKARLLPNGNILCLGRLDDQVKVGGFRIHLNEIENKLMDYPNIALATVIVEIGGGQHKILTAFIILTDKSQAIHADDIRSFLAELLPAYMLPSKYVMIEELPLTQIGKVDKKKLGQMPHIDLSYHIDASTSHPIEKQIHDIWCHLLNRTSVDIHKNLFDLDASSLLLTESCDLINQRLETELKIADILSHPTVYKLARFIEGGIDIRFTKKNKQFASTDIAIIGMSCRFPKSNSLEEFWQNLCQKNDCLERFEPSLNNSNKTNYVPVRGILSDIEKFDAGFFGFNPIDASIADPQHRIFLEVAWEALEHAGVAPQKSHQKTISVFAGMTDSTYVQENLLKNHWFLKEFDQFQQRITSSIGMLSTLLSYRLNLKGRSVNVNTACSTGLIAVDQACQELIIGDSDIALAGAVSVIVPQHQGFEYQEGSILSSNGICAPFSDQANGTVFSNGVGVVILKRLEDAVAERDTIYAVIKGRSVNNDGSDKLGFTAPSRSGQITCILNALENAKLEATAISYIEAHGTGTHLGDIVEFDALKDAFKTNTKQTQFCALGTVKSNIGHTDVAAGMAGLIKTILCLHHQCIPPMANFEKPNPELNIDRSPFYINKEPIHWDNKADTFYAGVSAFGVGGTNSHLILSEYRKPKKPNFKKRNPSMHLLTLSAKSETALETMTQNLCVYLSKPKHNTPEFLQSAAFTLQTGREDFAFRRYAIGQNSEEITASFSKNPIQYCEKNADINIVFMLPGEGTQYSQMAQQLMSIPYFAHIVEKGAKLASKHLNCNFLSVLQQENSTELDQTQYAQPALFIIEYAVGKLLMQYGIQPNAIIGHSVGEYVAACLADVFSFEDGVAVVCERAILMAKTAKDIMLDIDCSLGNFEVTHSEWIDKLSNIAFNTPNIPIISNLTGDWLSSIDAVDPQYWYQHLINPVKLKEGLHILTKDENSIFIEVGPKQSMSYHLKSILKDQQKNAHTMTHVLSPDQDIENLLSLLALCWTKSINIDWQQFYQNYPVQKTDLPPYCFQKQRYWIQPDTTPLIPHRPQVYSPTWSYQPISLASPSTEVSTDAHRNFIVFFKPNRFNNEFLSRLKKTGITPFVIEANSSFLEKSPNHCCIDSSNPQHYALAFDKVHFKSETVMFHLFSTQDQDEGTLSDPEIEHQLNLSFYSFLYGIQTYLQSSAMKTSLQCAVISTGIHKIIGNESMHPVNASLVGAIRAAQLEHPQCKFKLFDLALSQSDQNHEPCIRSIIDSCINQPWESPCPLIAYRHLSRYELDYVPVKSPALVNRFIDNGVYLISGGLGGVAFYLCKAILSVVKNPAFILVSRSATIHKSKWPSIISQPLHQDHSKISDLQTLEDLGARLHWHSLDINDEITLTQLIRFYQNKYSKINGVIHAAGIPGDGVLQLKSKPMTQPVFYSKLFSAYKLSAALQGIELDFVVLMSSIAAITGEIGQIDYAAANACLDSVAVSNLFSSKFTVSINWNTWLNIGMADDSKRPMEINYTERGNYISPSQGQAFFLEIMRNNCTNVTISNQNIDQAITNLSKENQNTSVQPFKTERNHLNLSVDFLKPQTSTETKIAQLWQNTLGINEIGLEDNFFAMGGHSLKALKLIEDLNQTFDHDLSLPHLYTYPTIGELAQHIDSNSVANKMSIIIPLKLADSTAPTLFCCHPISGMVNCFDSIIAHWQQPINIYGLQDLGIFNDGVQYDNMIAMAHTYLNAIKTVQPTGPYNLLGYSFGGTLVYEVANLLKKNQEEVKLLALIDGWCLFPDKQKKEDYFKTEFKIMHKELSNNLVNLAWLRMQLLEKYIPSKTDLDFILFKASDLLNDYKLIDHPSNGWSNHTNGNITQVTIDANHHTIVNHEHSLSMVKILENINL